MAEKLSSLKDYSLLWRSILCYDGMMGSKWNTLISELCIWNPADDGAGPVLLDAAAPLPHPGCSSRIQPWSQVGRTA